MFRIIFVLDILNGSAVHAVRGERAKYHPIEGSRVCGSSSPLDIISSLMPGEVYIADLDKLLHIGDNFELIRRISLKTKTMADTGAENMHNVEKSLKISDTLVLGTETASLDLIKKAARLFPERINVSIDIKNGRVLAKDRRMQLAPEALVEMLNECGFRDLIILNLSKVGTGEGIDVEFLRKMVELSSHTVLAGGGIRDMKDIDALKKIGAGGALVATAVHSGRIPLELIR